MFVPPSTTRGTWRWGWEGVAQPVVEYILLAFAASIFVVVWLKWFYCIRLRIGRTDAQDEHSVLPTQQQSTTYGSVSTAQRGAHRSKPGKTKQKTLAQHANTEPARTPTRAPTRSGTSGYTVNGRVPPQKGATIHRHYATQPVLADHHESHHGSSSHILSDGNVQPLHTSLQCLISIETETHDEPQSLYPNQPLAHEQSQYRQASTSRGGRGHASTMHIDHAQTLPPPQPRPPVRTITIPAIIAQPQVDSPIDDDPAYTQIDREWEREHLHGAGLHAPSNRQTSSGSDRDDDLIDAALQEGPAKRYREKAREEARSRRAAFEASKKAYRANRKAEAKQLSDLGKMHDENVRRYNSMAAAEIFRLNNPRYGTTQRYSRCDLHGLHIEEAKQYAESHVQTCYQAGVDKTMLIVGKGAHSQRGAARIKPAILDMMRGRPGILAGQHEKNEGCIVIEFVRHHPGHRL